MYFTRDDWDEQFDHFPEDNELRCDECGEPVGDEFADLRPWLGYVMCCDCHTEWVEGDDLRTDTPATT